MASFNVARLSEDIKREISAHIRDVKDPRVSGGLVSVTHCELTNDLSYCKIFVSSLGGEEKTAEAVEGLKSASGYLKKQLAARIKMRKMPELIFVPDNSLEYYQHIEEVIKHLPKPAANEED